MPQERFRWSLWPICVGWLLALWAGWDGAADLSVLLKGGRPWRGFVLGFVYSWATPAQIALALAQIVVALTAVPSLVGWLSGRTLLAVGETGLTFDRWSGWRRIDWSAVERLEFSFGDAVFHLREDAGLTTLRFRPWTIGLDQGSFLELVERHQPRLTRDEDDGQPWARSSSFRS